MTSLILSVSNLAAVISSIVFDLDIVFSAITTTFVTVVDHSNTCAQIARLVWFNRSCQLKTLVQEGDNCSWHVFALF